MKRLAAVLTALPLFGAITFNNSKALAEPFVSTAITGITSLDPSADNYNYYNGYVSLADGNFYYWGGSFCSSYSKPSLTEIQMLSDAVVANKVIGLRYKTGTYGTPCITGITIYYNNFHLNGSNSALPSQPKLPK